MSVPTARQSERLALVVAAIGVAALVVEAASPSIVLAGLSGLATGGALRYVRSDDEQIAVAARSVGAIGIVGGTLGAFTAVTFVGGGTSLAGAAVAAGAWIALVATVAVVSGSDAGEQFRAAAWTTSIAGVGVGLAAVTGIGALLAGTAPVVGPTAWIWAVLRWLVTGGTPTTALSILSFLLGVLCIVVVTTPPTAPPRPRASESSDAADGGTSRLKVWFSLAGIAFLVAALLLYFLPLSLPVPGPLVVVEHALRAVILIAIVALLLAALTTAVVKRWVWPDGRPLRSVSLSILAGAIAAVVLTVGVGLTARTGSFEPWIGLGIVACIAIGTVPLVETTLAVSGLLETLVRRAVAVPAAALVLGAVGASQVGASLAPVVAVGAALIVWDALCYRRDLRSEVFHADTLAVERRHLGATVGVVTVAVAAGAALLGVTSLLGPSLGGEPLVVVVVGATLLAVVTVVVARWNPT